MDHIQICKSISDKIYKKYGVKNFIGSTEKELEKYIDIIIDEILYSTCESESTKPIKFKYEFISPTILSPVNN